MRKTLLLLPLLLGLLPKIFGQDASPSFTPGRWYAGFTYQQLPFLAANRTYQPGILAGYNFHPRLSLQAGLTVVGRSETKYPMPSEMGFAITGTLYHFTHFNTGAYLPVFLRYLFSQPHRRFQTYGLAGFHTSFQSSEYFRVTYQDSKLGSQEGPFKYSNNNLKPSIGAGLRVRAIDRLFLNAELKVHYQRMPYSQAFLSKFPGQQGIGLQYEFR
ncbi:hypothetical protein BH24BAC1_BH24BAC1_01630 [soil metagenome]